jgi:hypothetical protein
MAQRPSFEEIQKQHQALLRQLSEVDDVDLDDPLVKVFLERVNEFLDILSQAGTYTENSERRSLLRDFIRYWSSEINTKTGNLRIIQLQPLNLGFFQRLFKPYLLIIVLVIVVISISIFALISFLSSSSFQCPTSQQVSMWMHVSVSTVPGEACAFTAGNSGKKLSGVVCTNQDGGTTIQFTPVDQQKTIVVKACDGNQLPNIWVFTIRFDRGYPLGDASVCAISLRAQKQVPAGWNVQPTC